MYIEERQRPKNRCKRILARSGESDIGFIAITVPRT